MSELEATGIGFQIDHYVPRAEDDTRRADYENLLWACQKCNSAKWKYHPDEEQVAAGKEILRPDWHDPRDHYHLSPPTPTGDTKFELSHLTPAGEFNIERLRLNGHRMRHIREVRSRLLDADEVITNGLRFLDTLKLDRVRRNTRPLVLALKRDLPAKLEAAQAEIKRRIRELCRSPLLDSDSAHENTQARRDFLKDLGAIVPGIDPQ